MTGAAAWGTRANAAGGSGDAAAGAGRGGGSVPSFRGWFLICVSLHGMRVEVPKEMYPTLGRFSHVDWGPFARLFWESFKNKITLNRF